MKTAYVLTGINVVLLAVLNNIDYAGAIVVPIVVAMCAITAAIVYRAGKNL